jgi:hypothetical protein
VSSKGTVLSELLNDESFLRWLKKDTDAKESEKWEQWLSEDSQRKNLVAKARKFLNMPFKSSDVTAETKKQEYHKLMKRLEEIEQNADFEEE